MACKPPQFSTRLADPPVRHLAINLPAKQSAIRLYPVTDLQYGARGCDVAGFREYLRDGVQDPLGRFFGGGDYGDGMSPSNRRNLQASYVKGEFYDTFQGWVDFAAQQDVKEMKKFFKPSIGMWDFMLQGHHHHEYWVGMPDGTKLLRSTDMDLAEYVKCPYLGATAEDEGTAKVTYHFPSARRGEPGPVLRVFAMHGESRGSSESLAVPLTALEKQMRSHVADIYFTGHYHKLVAAKAVKLEDDPGKPLLLGAQNALLVAGGSWLHGYLKNQTTYAEGGMMLPLATGAPTIYVERQRDNTLRMRAEIGWY
jgi:hypothetical protein